MKVALALAPALSTRFFSLYHFLTYAPAADEKEAAKVRLQDIVAERQAYEVEKVRRLLAEQAEAARLRGLAIEAERQQRKELQAAEAVVAAQRQSLEQQQEEEGEEEEGWEHLTSDARCCHIYIFRASSP